MNQPQLLSISRNHKWSNLPTSSGVYWWYFPPTALEQLRISEFCNVEKLKLRTALDGRICLYHGLAKNLAQRVEWHAAQKLTFSCLESGFLSTFRLTLLALNEIDYSGGDVEINNYFDDLSLSWKSTNTREEAELIERSELHGEYHYPLNIQGNKRPELLNYINLLKVIRKNYKRRNIYL
ncbi:GIY-YIG nuclease family protein [Undibacterium sp. SXout7W]|uniref:GIY-YIG nuclease family protein n=1 Tax=Undibacterium sp. SXout7W TaxID=3413049 RepID=UPI003BF33224